MDVSPFYVCSQMSAPMLISVIVISNTVLIGLSVSGWRNGDEWYTPISQEIRHNVAV